MAPGGLISPTLFVYYCMESEGGGVVEQQTGCSSEWLPPVVSDASR